MNIKFALFNVSKDSMEQCMKHYNEKVPQPLHTKFPDKKSKADAVRSHEEKGQAATALFPSGMYVK